jgi:molybdopterin synthase catalytic subunit
MEKMVTEKNNLDINRMIDSLKSHPGHTRMGMIASHLGVVRGTSLNGQEVKAIEVSFDREQLDIIAKEIKALPGIIDVLVDFCEGRLEVGDYIMAVVVGGDTREHVFPALISAVDRIKTEATRKREVS